MNVSEKFDKVLPALMKARKAFPAVLFDKKNSHFGSKYATLGSYLDAVWPALLEQGLFLSQGTVIVDAQTVVQTQITHTESGQFVRSEYPVHAVKPEPQAEGSALTYARRYALSSLLALTAEDDDGNAAQAASSGLEKATPTGGVLESLPADAQEVCRKVASTIREYAEQGDFKGANDYVDRQGLSTEMAVGTWSLLESKIRTALTKAKKEAA